MTAIEEIKARLNIVDLVSETVKLRRAGKNYTGFCPFHPNSRTPAFVVFPDSGTWRCFGACNEGGDVFKYVMKKEGWDFAQTLRFLAEKAGVQLEPVTPEKQAAEEEHERLRTLMEEAVNYYRHHLTRSPGGKEALAYLQRRGLKPETIEAFGLGYAPSGWDNALSYFTGKGYTADELLQAGLLSERSESSGMREHPEGKEASADLRRVYDRFRNRVMFPIRDGMGRMCGFGARILDPNDVPKFLNSPQTVLFDKGHLLYGLDAARKAIRAQDQVVIVEGYLDVITLHQAGFLNTVSPMGTALTEDQMRLLKRFTRRIVLALDADTAGEKATLRGLEIARQSLDRAEELTFDARGLLRHEARLQADVRVTTLPEGMDPDEVVLRDPAEWSRILAAAQPVVIHVMDTLAAGQDIDDPKVKTTIAAQVLPLIEDVPSAIERDSYRQRLARVLRIDERALLGAQPSSAPRPGGRARRPRASVEQRLTVTLDSARIGHTLERHVLRLLLRQPDVLYLVDRTLQQAGLGRVSLQDFEHSDHQIAAKVIMESLEQDHLDPQAFIRENTPESLQELFAEMLQPMALGEPGTNKLLNEAIGVIVRLRHMRITESINQLRFLQEEAQDQGDTLLESYQQTMLEYTRTLVKLNKAPGLRNQID